MFRSVHVLLLCTMLSFGIACSDGDDSNNAGNPTNTNTTSTADSNKAPVADAGTNQEGVLVGTEVSLNGGESADPEGAVLTLKWTLIAPEGSSATLDRDDTFRVFFTPDLPGIYEANLVVNDGTQDSEVAQVFVQVVPDTSNNQPPVADAGEAMQFGFVKGVVTFDGSASSDPDGDELTYTWSITQAPQGSEAKVETPRASKTLFSPDVEGDYIATLIVNDGRVDSEPDTVKLTATMRRPNNMPPVADAGEDLAVNVGDMVQLDGSGSSDPEEGALKYRWSLMLRPDGSTAELNSADAATPTFVADKGGFYRLSLVVEDDQQVESQVDELLVTAKDLANNKPPVAVVAQDTFSVVPQTSITLDGSGSSDPDDDPLRYTWTIVTAPNNNAATIENATQARATLTPVELGTYTLEFEVSDGVVSAPKVTVTINVTEVPMPSDCLIFSEYIEGSSNNKAAELYNCSGKTLDLSDYSVCRYSNSAKTCTQKEVLSGILQAGEVFTMCHPSIARNIGGVSPKCDLKSMIMNVNGNDQIAVFIDADSNDEADFTETVDVFGSLDVAASNGEWEDVTLRRCNPTPFDGQGAFPIDRYTDIQERDNFSDFGLPPASGITCGMGGVNRAPVANINAPPVALTGSTITLDGSGSSDPDGDVLSFMWTLKRQPATSKSTLMTAMDQATLVLDQNGDYVVELIVSDAMLTSPPLEFTINATNTVPQGRCGRFSEVIEGKSDNKGLEIFNCNTTQPLDLSKVGICTVVNNATTCTYNKMLSGMLSANSVHGVCNSRISEAQTGISKATQCQELIAGGVMQYNGNDRLILFYDNNNNGTFQTGTDDILDAFGETTKAPPGNTRPYEDTTYRRCNWLLPYDGTGPFDPAVQGYQESVMVDDFSTFGQLPPAGCI